ncbi:40S ribosomal protein S6 [Paramarasmius palmivorus]|uniref:40S ribosomal protein S6 n=1 Tax=Paramarasmius palmivorus TaxID=297713 RepID=A0AAW0EFS0_9AGAR
MPAYSRNAPSDLAGFTTAIFEPADDRVVITVTALFALALLLHRLLRRLYPCLTVVELNKAEASLDDIFDEAVKDGYLRGSEQDVIDQSRIRVKNRASEIRTQSLEAPASIWKKCFNVEVELFSVIIDWYAGVEALEREIATIVELEKRYRYNIELGRRTMVATNV